MRMLKMARSNIFIKNVVKGNFIMKEEMDYE